MLAAFTHACTRQPLRSHLVFAHPVLGCERDEARHRLPHLTLPLIRGVKIEIHRLTPPIPFYCVTEISNSLEYKNWNYEEQKTIVKVKDTKEITNNRAEGANPSDNVFPLRVRTVHEKPVERDST
jgi:hypothetical protein